MTVRTLRITEQMAGKRRLIYINGLPVFIRPSFYDTIVKLSKSDKPLRDTELNADPLNVPTAICKWHKELGDPNSGGRKMFAGVKIIERNGRGRFLSVEQIQWECEFGRVPI